MLKIIWAALERLFSRPEPKAYLSEDGERLLGLDIEYVGNSSLPYGRSATRYQEPYRAIVFHHPASAKLATVETLIRVINSPRQDGIMYGYHFVIAPNGKIYQVAPLNKRVNQVKSTRNRNAFGRDVTNRNAIGISFHHASHNPGMAPNRAQREAGKRLVTALREVFGTLPIYGHGEIQTDKHPQEGRAFATQIRSKP